MTATTTTALFEPTMKDGIRWTRRFSPTEDPYETIEFELRDVVLVDPTGKVVFEQRGILVPKFWSDSAVSIMAQHYLKGRQGTTERENAVTQAVDRVVNTIRRWAQEGRPAAGRPAHRPRLMSDDRAAAASDSLRPTTLSSYRIKIHSTRKLIRTQQRRVGKEFNSRCRSRW